MFGDAGTTRLVVFSHPNHELAIFGLLQRVRPHLVYLTDGGGEARVAQTRQGLASIGLEDQARFLNHPEQALYDALLAGDSAFYAAVADQVRAAIHAIEPAEILCDAVEFYNPVHDMSLPVAWAALGGSVATAIFEVPLVHQKPGEVEAYEVQRLPASRRHQGIELRLSDEELAAKLEARDRIYTILTGQMGPVVSSLSSTELGLEVVAPAGSSLPEPGPDVVLRYERRAALLLERGEIEQSITYARHYVPMASFLMNPRRAVPPYATA